MKLVQMFLCLALITIFEPMNVNGTFFKILESAGNLFGIGRDKGHHDACQCPQPSCPPPPKCPPPPPCPYNPYPSPPNPNPYPSPPNPNPFPSPSPPNPNPFPSPPNPNPFPSPPNPNSWPFPPNFPFHGNPPSPNPPPPAAPPVDEQPCIHPCGEQRESDETTKRSSMQRSEDDEKSLIQPLSGLDSKPNLNDHLQPDSTHVLSPEKFAFTVKANATTAANSPPAMNVTTHDDTTGASKLN